MGGYREGTYTKCIAGIYYESFNFANFVNQNALAKIKASIYFWINFVQTKCIASN